MSPALQKDPATLDPGGHFLLGLPTLGTVLRVEGPWGQTPPDAASMCLKIEGASLVAQLVKSLPAMWETWVWKIPLRREQLPTPVFWSGEFHGLYSPWGRKESDTTEQLSLSLNKTLTGKKRSQEMETYLESCIQIQTVPQSTPFTFQ